MSMCSPATVDCPRCDHQQTVTVWQTLNAQVSPEALDDFWAGKINLFVCEKCGHHAQLPLELMYHDMNRKFAVLLVPLETLSDPEVLKRFDPDGKFSIKFPEMVRSHMEMSGGNYIANPDIALSMQALIERVYFRELVWDYHHSDSSGKL